MTGPGEAPTLLPVRLPALTPRQLACLLAEPPPQLLVDCGEQLLPHPLGVCRFVTQLLHLHLRGTRIWLYQVHPKLRHYLHGLKLGTVFHLHELALPADAVLAGAAASPPPLT
ncbi:hypothetical protein GCM10027422_35380 [Hymenobacter arcticus]